MSTPGKAGKSGITPDIARNVDVNVQNVSGQEIKVEHMSPATRLLEKLRQTFDVQEKLEQHKASHKEQEAKFRAREEALRQKDMELQESLTKFSRFLQENDVKRARALRKAADDHKVVLSKEAEIEEVQLQLEELEERRQHTLQLLQRRMIYAKFLESVVEAMHEAGQPVDIQDLLRRHATLTANLQELAKQQSGAQEELENLRKMSQQYRRTKATEVLSLNNRVSVLKQVLEQVQGQLATAETQQDVGMAEASQAALQHGKNYQAMLCVLGSCLAKKGQEAFQHGKVLMAIDNIYTRCVTNSCVAHHDGLGPVEKLSVIGNFVGDLGSIIKAHNLQPDAQHK